MRGRGLQNDRGGGGQVKCLPLRKKRGGGGKSFSHAEGGGAQYVLEQF